MPEHRRWLPPRDLERVVVILACIVAVLLVVTVGALVYGVGYYLPQRDEEIQVQRLDGARAQCRLVAELGQDTTGCAVRVCQIASDLGQDCSVREEEELARHPSD